MELQASIAEGLQSVARLFQDRSREEQMALLAALERAGATVYRSLAEGEQNVNARAALLTAARREEQNAELLEKGAERAAEPLVVAPGAGPAHVTPFGDTVMWKAGEEATDGAFSVHERTAPPGARSVGHAHALSEAFFVLEGEFQFRVGGKDFAGRPGTFVLAPPGVMHGWVNSGAAPAKALLIFAPSAALGYFEELDALTKSTPEGRPRSDDMDALAKKYGWS